MVRSRLRSLLVEQLAGNPALIGSPFVGWMKARLQFRHLLQVCAPREERAVIAVPPTGQAEMAICGIAALLTDRPIKLARRASRYPSNESGPGPPTQSASKPAM